jgi:hypothetical protein
VEIDEEIRSEPLMHVHVYPDARAYHVLEANVTMYARVYKSVTRAYKTVGRFQRTHSM